MRYEWDPAKAASNFVKHSVDFRIVDGFDWDTAAHAEDIAAEGERRFIAKGFIGPRLFVLVYTDRGDVVRVISLRQASKAERKRYERG